MCSVTAAVSHQPQMSFTTLHFDHTFVVFCRTAAVTLGSLRAEEQPRLHLAHFHSKCGVNLTANSRGCITPASVMLKHRPLTTQSGLCARLLFVFDHT